AGYVTGMVTDVWHYFKGGMNLHEGFHSWQFIRGQEADPYLMDPLTQDPQEVMDPALKGKLMQYFLEQYLRNTGNRKYEEDYFAPQVFRAAERWLEKNARHYEKFFLYIDCFDPHEPWDPPREYVELYDPGYKGKEYIFPQNGPCDQMTEDEIRHIRAMYAGKVTMVDRWFGHFMEKFELMGLEEDTILLFLSDHGVQLGDHGIMKKMGYALYTELLEPPMMLMVPGASSGEKRIQDFVQECDFAPTLLRMAGIEAPESMTGLDFWPLVTGQKDTIREHAVGGFHIWGYVQDKRYHYFRKLLKSDGASLFDLEKDAMMEHNLAENDPELSRIMEEKLVRELDGWVPPKELLGTRVYDIPYVPLRTRSGAKGHAATSSMKNPGAGTQNPE
ncbi:MAG: sulfatase-like hydrolase/transferase, partial [Deltaproteobacteria bacterium]|nr:sulfatase-like hydrolase/transferase [Deltaproteobacteria bacterium]